MSVGSSFHQSGARTANSLDVEWLARSAEVTSRLAVGAERTCRGVRCDHIPDVDGARSVRSAVRQNQCFEADAFSSGTRAQIQTYLNIEMMVGRFVSRAD